MVPDQKNTVMGTGVGKLKFENVYAKSNEVLKKPMYPVKVIVGCDFWSSDVVGFHKYAAHVHLTVLITHILGYFG